MESHEQSDTIVTMVERAIFQIGWLSQRQFMQLLAAAQFDLTVPQYYTLAHLARCDGGCKMSDLAKATHQSAASLTGVVDRLLEKQLVERARQSDDRRQVMVAITPRGTTLLSEIAYARHAAMQAALHEMDVAEQHELLRLLTLVSASLGQHVKHGE